VNMIKQLVVEQQLVGSGRSTSAECNGLDKTNQDDMKRDQKMNQKGVPVDDGRNSSLEDEKHDLSRSRTAKVDSGKDDNNKKEAKQGQKGGSQRVQHRGRARQLKGHSSTEGSIEGEEDTDGKAVLMKSKVACRLDNPAHYSEKVDQEIDEEQEQKDAPVEDGKTSSLKNEHDHSLPGTAKNDSGKPKHNREDAQQSRKEKNQKDIDGKGASMNSEAANGHDGTAPDFMQVDREMDKDQKQNDLPVEDRKTSSLENEDRSRPGIAKNDSGKTKRDRKDAHQSETKKNQKGVSHPEQHRSAGHQARRQTGHLSTEDSNPDEEDSQDDAATRNVETASAAESVQTSTDDVQGMRARTRNTEPRTERLQDNAGETNIFPNDDDKSAAFTGTQDKCRVREHIWAYIQFIDPESQWDKKFSVFSDTKQDNDTVELTGSSADIDSFKKFCDTARFQRAIVRKMQRVPERLTAKVFRGNLLDLGLSQRKVLVRLRDDDLRSCEFVGKRSEITELEKAISDKFPELVEKQQTSDIQQSTTLTRPASVINEAASQLSAETTKQMSETGLEFQTERSQLRVRIVTGDLLEWRCEVLVNSCDGDLSHAGGLSWLFAKAAGPKMQADCTAYIRQYGRLPQCEIMSTVAGDLPVRRIIHAHGPDARSYRDLNDCRTKLEKTFFNCLVHANDNLQARSIALPALSSGES